MDIQLLIALAALFVALFGAGFAVFTYRKKAGADELVLLKARVQDLEFKLNVANATVDRLSQENFSLMRKLVSHP